MKSLLYLSLILGFLASNSLADDRIASAMSAAPESISADAQLMDWDFNVIREGSNGWTCLPDRPDTDGNPYATEPTGPDDWVTDLGAHLMILNPDLSLLKNISTDHLNGGPWVMWPDTPYAHIMVPLENRGR